MHVPTLSRMKKMSAVVMRVTLAADVCCVSSQVE
jgi:hypothetical protein